MSNTLEAIGLLENKLQSLLSNYDFLRKENEILIKRNMQLQQQIKEKEQLFLKQEEEYKILKIAKTIEGSSEHTRDTKLKINALIREIDKCIIQLNE
jgi:hypothetical protein